MEAKRSERKRFRGTETLLGPNYDPLDPPRGPPDPDGTTQKCHNFRFFDRPTTDVSGLRRRANGPLWALIGGQKWRGRERFWGAETFLGRIMTLWAHPEVPRKKALDVLYFP